MSLRHPVFSGAHSYKMQGRWVKHKTTGMIGYITFVVKYRQGIETEVYVVWPFSPHNKRIGLNSIAGGAYRPEELVVIKGRRRKDLKWNGK